MNILYKLTFASGKVYIGQTVRTMEIRLSQHRTAANRGSPLAVHCAWRKYGDPLIEIIGEYRAPEELHKAEIAAIAEYDCRIPNGYNISTGGDTSPATVPEVAAKIAEKARGRKINNTERRKEIAAELWQRPEYREARSAKSKALWADPEYRAKVSAKQRAGWAKKIADGWTMPEETKAKLRGRKRSDEARAKMSAAQSGKKRGPLSAEARAKIAEKTRQAWQNKELTARRIEAMKAAKVKETESAA